MGGTRNPTRKQELRAIVREIFACEFVSLVIGRRYNFGRCAPHLEKALVCAISASCESGIDERGD